MNKHLNVRQTLELVERIRVTVSDLTARTRRNEADFKTRLAAERYRFEAVMTAGREALETELEQAAAREQEDRTSFERWSTRRLARLQKAQRGARRSAMDRIEREEGGHKYAVQKGTLAAERTEKDSTAANEAHQEEFRVRFSQQEDQLTGLERHAASSFRGYPGFRRALRASADGSEPEPIQDENAALDTVAELAGRAAEDVRTFRKLWIPAAFRIVPPWLALGLIALAGAGAVWLPPHVGARALTVPQAGSAAGAAFVVLGLLFWMGRKAGASSASRAIKAVTRARRLHTLAGERAGTRYAQERQRISGEAAETRRNLEERWNRSLAEAGRRRDEWPRLEADKVTRARRRWETLATARRTRLEQAQEAAREAIRTTAGARQQTESREHDAREGSIRDARSAGRAGIEVERKARVDPLRSELEAARETAVRSFPSWDAESWREWSPPERFGHGVPLGEVRVDLVRLCGGPSEELSWIWPGAMEFTLPLVLTYPEAGSLLIETTTGGTEAASGTLNQVLLRLLASMPPGKVSFTIIDPVRLGQNFAGVMHLADFEENLINRRIWTQPAEIEQQLADLAGHMEKVIQMYLRNEYATITEYNAQAGNIAEKYHFLVVADFPSNFSDVALRRLVNIATSGARCGVFTLLHWDRRQTAPPDWVVESLRQNCVVLTQEAQRFALGQTPLPGLEVRLMPAPPPEWTTGFLRQVGASGQGSGLVRVPFAQVAPDESGVWSLETTDEVRVAIGRTGATKLQYLALGRGTRQHALVAGKTGSGKSTLFHVVITNLALWCRPDQVEFYLVDFKKGVEFKCYGAARLPHARVVAIESDREFGLSVLQRLDEELRRRGDLFRQLGVQDLAGYRRAAGGQPMPRTLLLIDEFQEFFVEDDRVSQSAAVLLDRIVRQGRAFGIHVVLGSQTLGGAYTLARTTLGQMGVRIALQCNEADALLIMDDTNPAPRLLTRPGEGIYNDLAGMVEGNSPFQTVWLGDEERDTLLGDLRRRADERGQAGLSPFVFEGNAPAVVRDNHDLAEVMAAATARPPAAARLWLGAPNAIKGPTMAEFRRQSGAHLLLVGQREDAELAILTVGLLGLAAQFPVGTARFVLLDSTIPGSSQQEYLREVVEALPVPATVTRAVGLPGVLAGLVEDMKRRTESPADEAPSIFVFVHGLHRFKQLIPEDEFGFSRDANSQVSPANLLKELLSGGAAAGIHVIATCDSYNNLHRYLSRKSLSDFGMRVLFQMSANDSSSLIDSPKAATLGLHRALLHHESEGWLETFRPYALPDRLWVAEVRSALAERAHRTAAKDSPGPFQLVSSANPGEDGFSSGWHLKPVPK